MDRPPADHGSDRYAYVEVRSNAPLPEDLEERLLGLPWYEAVIASPCPDCQANVFLTYDGAGELTERSSYDVMIAHDSGCPTMAQIEADPVGFKCPRCGRVSYHPADKAEGYCANCNQYTGSSS